MRIVLQQVFPLGRFHATPWRANPFDDPHGEWPPSPWRLVRAVVARWYQCAREATSTPSNQQLDELVQALCMSGYRFHLPRSARRGSPLRQYFPQEFGWNPKTKKKAGVRGYGASLAQDNYWCVAPTNAVWWFLDGHLWTDPLVGTLDRCLDRIIYFGRAETFTRIRRARNGHPEPNCDLLASRVSTSVPVLVPSPTASRTDVERVTDDEENRVRSIPLGARVMYATTPPRPRAHEVPNVRPVRRDCQLVQLALAWNVAPEVRSLVRLTARFRGAVLWELLQIKAGSRATAWSRVELSVREAMADMSGKDAFGRPLAGHRHAEFLAWCEDGSPTRLLVWREGRPFDDDEHTAILRAASRDLSWAAAGDDADAWRVRLVPLDTRVPHPPGFDGVPARSWVSTTPYVPARHHLRRGKLRDRESLVSQIRRELAQREFERTDEVGVDQVGGATWVAVHVPRRDAEQRSFLGDRLGYSIRLTFPQPIKGPLRLGHSSSFGLGMFAPIRGTQ